MHEEEEEQNVTEFLNADLDLDAAQGLDELVEALAPATAISRFGAIVSLELDRQPASPECAIGGFVTLVEKLPPRLRTIWDNARSRPFDVGIQPSNEPHSVVYVLSSDVLSLIHSISANLAFTIYLVQENPD